MGIPQRFITVENRSNAQRQARYRQRLKEKGRGVTADDIIKSARLIHARYEDEDFADWEGLLKNMQKNIELWWQWLPDDPDGDYSDFGKDAAMMGSVAKVVHAVLVPPRPKHSVTVKKRR